MKIVLALAVLVLAASSAAAQCDVDRPDSFQVAGDEFGFSLDVSGDRLIVGSREANADDSGSAHVYRYVPGTGWVFEQVLTPGDPGSNDHFGQSVAIDGDLAVVGMADDDDVMNGAGSAYVYARELGVWTFKQKLPNPEPSVQGRFGWAVATNGNKIAVGCKGDDALFSNSGAVYVYRFDNPTWVQEIKLKASDAADIQQLSDSLDYDGDAIVAGAWQDSEIATFAGAAYVFRNSEGATWFEEQKLTASDAADFDWFGRSVAIENDAICVGAYRADDGAADGPGAAYVFRYGAGVWTEEDRLQPNDWIGDDNNGWSCDIWGDLAVVGSKRNDEQGGDSGAAYLFRNDGLGNWSQVAKLAAADGASGDELGTAVGLWGDFVLAGAPNHDASAGALLAWEYTSPGCLDAGGSSISLSAGGTQPYFLTGGNALAGNPYLILGSASGTSPGLLVDGLLMPLNFDAYTIVTLSYPNTIIAGSFGFLGTAGEADASLTLPAGSDPTLAGVGLDHAFLVLSLATFSVGATSNAVHVTLAP